MKKAYLLFIAVILFPLIGSTQIIDGIDYFSPFNEDVAAIKKGNDWAFINNQGDIVIDFRDDLVLTRIDNYSYPIFKDGRCLITQKKDGISYFGYIDRLGKTIIKPRFLNATNFINNRAIALELVKVILGENELLGKTLVAYDYFDVIIDSKGEVLHYLSDPNRITLSSKHIKTPPEIKSKLISDTVFAIMTSDNTWEIKNINEKGNVNNSY